MQLLFGIPYIYAVVTVGALMVCYVMFGGMVATTWVQIVKASILLVTGTVTAVLVMASFGFSYDALIARAVAAHPRHAAILMPQTFAAAPFSTLSLGVALFFGGGRAAAPADAVLHRP